MPDPNYPKSYLKYNDIKIYLSKTISYEQKIVYDETNTDYLYQEYRIVVQGVVSDCLNEYSTLGATASMQVITSALLTPRKKLLYVVDDETLLEAPYGTDVSDSKNGPTPVAFNIIKQTGSGNYIVSYEIICRLSKCSDQLDGSGDIIPANLSLSNRWSMSHSIDTNYLSTRTVTGKVIVDTRGGIENISPDNFRDIVWISIPKGWKRETAEFKTSADGTTLEYSIVDKENHLAIPKPATNITASYTETAGVDQTVTENTIDVFIEGAPKTSALDLLQIATQIAFSRIKVVLGSESSEEEPFEYIKSTSIKEGIYPLPSISLQITTQRSPQLIAYEEINLAPLRIDALITNADITNDVARFPTSRAGYLAKLYCAAPQICIAEDLSGTVYGENTEDPDKDSNSNDSTSGSFPDPSDDKGWSSEQRTNPYTDYQIDISIKSNGLVMQMPSMGLDAPNVFGRIGPHLSQLIVRWSSSRRGDRPQIPDPKDADDNLVLMKEIYFPSNVELASDGKTLIYRSTGEFTFGMKVAYDKAQDLTLALSPVYGASHKTDNTISPSQYANQIFYELGKQSPPTP